MAKKKSKETKPVSQKEIDLLKPVDILSLGSEHDCFGKEYDLSTDECKRCGDSEFCVIATAARMKKVRGKVEKEVEFKDISQGSIPKEVYKFIENKMKRKVPLDKIGKRIVKRFGIPSNQVKELIKSYK